MLLTESSSATLNSCVLSDNIVERVIMHMLEADCAQEGAGTVRWWGLQHGGAVHIRKTSLATLNSCTLSNNSAFRDG